MAQQPLRATCLSILGQAAHGQFGLLPVGARHISQHGVHGRGATSQCLAEGVQRNTAQAHLGLSHSIHGVGQLQDCRIGFQPGWPLHHAQLVFQHAALRITPCGGGYCGNAKRHATRLNIDGGIQRHSAAQQHRADTDSLLRVGFKKRR